MKDTIAIRECKGLNELAECVELQREVFALPDIEISPVRHFIVTQNAGGFVLGAFAADELIGFVLSVPAFLRGHRAFYSHMTAVKATFQSFGIGGRLKWAQREKSLSLGVKFVKWTFEPWKARNGFFNLEKLGAEVRSYEVNFYGIDYTTAHLEGGRIGLASDRLFAEWDLESEKVARLAEGAAFKTDRSPVLSIKVPADWYALVKADPEQAIAEQQRIRQEFTDAFDRGLVARGFLRDEVSPEYLLYSE